MSASNTTQPSLATLMARFVQNQLPETLATDFEPYEQSASFATDTAIAWAETLQIAKIFGITTRAPNMPSEWTAIVRASKATAIVPAAIGYFPQLASDWSLLTAKLPSHVTKTIAESTCDKTVSKAMQSNNWFELVVAAGLCRLVGDLDRTETLLKAALTLAPSENAKQLIQHELAILTWVRGDRAMAMEQLSDLKTNGIVEFNRGVLALQMGDLTIARTAFHKTSSDLSDSIGWKLLADLYASTIA